ncbi:zinc ribbon-containing protein [Alishewanella sp. HL-SH05]|uniref:zinc ribbon-containing protein n=1 Tax=Alishewanella sp. HL-SH05 TaxID=3461145 RepID=UPI0040429FEF
MAEFKKKYQQWLTELTDTLEQAGQRQLDNMLEFSEILQAYLKAGKDLSAYESQLFVETLKQQWQAANTEEQAPSMWSEELWQQLSQITDRTQVEWVELLEDFNHQGVYYQGEYVGMGRYRCSQCQQSIDYTHPAELLCCATCGGVQFFRDGLPV